MAVYRAEEWQGACGNWYCNDTSGLGRNTGAWYHPARILDMSPAEFIKWLVDNYHPHIYHNEDCSFVGWYWDKQSDMRKYKNYINAKARAKNYQV